MSTLIILSIVLGLIGLATFLWAVGNGQFDDLDGAGWRIIPPEILLPTEGKSHDELAPDTQDRYA